MDLTEPEDQVLCQKSCLSECRVGYSALYLPSHVCCFATNYCLLLARQKSLLHRIGGTGKNSARMSTDIDSIKHELLEIISGGTEERSIITQLFSWVDDSL